MSMRLFSFTIASILLCSASYTYAAEIAVIASEKPIQGETIVVTFRLNAAKEPINALEGTLRYDTSQLMLRELRDGNSLVNFWLERPLDVNGSIRFAGITPGGYGGGSSELLALVFEVLKTGDVRFSLTDGKAFRNDGEATPASLTLTPSVRIESGATSDSSIESDATKPESFTITRTTSLDLFEGKSFIVFATQDKESGIDHYEVAEKSIRLGGFLLKLLSFETAESPHVLRGDGYIYVKAIDKAGNEQLEILSPEKRSPIEVGLTLFGILMLIAILYVRFFKK